MQVVAVRIDARFEGTMLFVKLLDHKLTALWTYCGKRLEMGDEIAFRIVGAAEELLSLSFCLTGDYFAVTARTRALCKRNGTGIVA